MVSFLPRIISTTLSSFMSTVSTNSLSPCATRGHAVADLQAAVLGRRAAGDEFHDFRVAFVGMEHRADADEREAHVDREVLELDRLMYSECGS